MYDSLRSHVEMVEYVAILVATFIHIVLKISIFFDLPLVNCSIAPSIASRIIFLALYSILQDAQPPSTRSYPQLGRMPRIIVETIHNIFAMEFVMIFVWCKLEMSIEAIWKYVLSHRYSDWNGDAIVANTILAFSIYVCYVTMIVTNFYGVLTFGMKQVMNRIRRCTPKRMQLKSQNVSGAECQPETCKYDLFEVETCDCVQ